MASLSGGGYLPAANREGRRRRRRRFRRKFQHAPTPYVASPPTQFAVILPLSPYVTSIIHIEFLREGRPIPLPRSTIAGRR